MIAPEASDGKGLADPLRRAAPAAALTDSLGVS
jgi:hypothetical protein